MNKFPIRQFSSLLNSIPKEPTVTNPTISGKLGKRNRNPIHIPHRTIPLPKGLDLDLRRADVALALYREMRGCRISPNVYTLNRVMAASRKVGKLENAVKVLEEMECMGCSPSVVSYHTLIAGHRDKGLLSSSLKFRNLMAKTGLHPTVVTFNTLSALIVGQYVRKNADRALELCLSHPYVVKSIEFHHFQSQSLCPGTRGNKEWQLSSGHSFLFCCSKNPAQTLPIRPDSRVSAPGGTAFV